jgi:outer membrane protein TolC
MLAVAQSPDLRLLRAQGHVLRAQAFAAGLLPDPVFGYSRDRPGAGQPGAATAVTRGISWDIGNLVTLSARQSARRHADIQVDLGLLWAEWQTIAQVRLEFIRVLRAREAAARLEAEAIALRPLGPHLQSALAHGALTFDVASVGLSAISDAERQLADANASVIAHEQALRDLLGVPASQTLNLVGDLELPALDEQTVNGSIDSLAQRRPDLRALEAGYDVQEARVRGAILGQFPAVNIGFNRSQDNSGISSSGFSLSVSLPIFDANRGAIRVEEASREELKVEYGQRLLLARSELARLVANDKVLALRGEQLGPFAMQLHRTVVQAEKSYASGALEWTVYLGIRQSALNADLELLTLRQSLAENRIALVTLAAGKWPDETAQTRGARL